MRGPVRFLEAAAIGTALMASTAHALTVVYVYRIDAESGRMLKGREYPMGKNPNWIEILDLP